MTRRRLAALVLALTGPALLPHALRAEEAAWQEDRVDMVTVLSQPGTARDLVLTRVVADHASLSRLVGLASVDPVTVRLFASNSALQAVQPLAVQSGTVLAYPRRSRREVAVVAPDGSTADMVAVALRHELAHRALVARTDGQLPEGFQEGLAAYLAGPASARAEDIGQLRLAWGRDGLRPWADLTAPGAAYAAPALSYPQARSLAQFLVEKFGLAAIDRWLAATADGAGWRAAMEQAFGQSPDELEQAWRSWLPSYLDGGWRAHLLFAPDLGQAEKLLARGDFTAAAALLDALAPAEGAPAGDLDRRARLVAAARAGAGAEASLDLAATALTQGDYAASAAAAAAAATALQAAGDAAGRARADELARRAQLGVAAQAALAGAEAMPAWRSIEARGLAAQAATGFAQLGNDVAADRARQLAQAVSGRLRPAGLALTILAVGLLAWNLRRRTADRRRAWA